MSLPFESDGTMTVTLSVSDLERAAAFYRDVIGLEMTMMNPEFNWASFESGVPGFSIGLGRDPGRPQGGGSTINFGVKNLEEAKAALEARGVEFDDEIHEVPGQVRLARCSDPDGNSIWLVQAIG